MSRRRKLFAGGIVVLVLAIGSGVFYFFQYQKAQALLKNPVLAANIERDGLTEKISKLMELPKDESPTVATVSDISKLKGQAFFAKAQNGDKLLLYPKAKQAILYSPKTNKIVAVGPITAPQSTQSAQPAAVKVSIYNGTKDANFVMTTEKQLKEKIRNITITGKATAAKTDYKKITVVDLTGSKPNVANQLAAFLGGEVGTLPAGETRPAGAEVLVILGK
jgi:hypothetical protein